MPKSESSRNTASSRRRFVQSFYLVAESASQLYIRNDVPFGNLLRNMHRWAAHAMIITGWMHQMRVFMTGSGSGPLCEPTGARETLARTTYQRFFRRYLRLGGITRTSTAKCPA